MNEIIKQNPELLLQKLGIDIASCFYKDDEIRTCCPLHDNADNPSAFCFNTEYINWRCYTRGCHEKMSSSPEALVSLKLNVSIDEASKKIMEWYGIKETGSDSSIPKSYDLSKIKKLKEHTEPKVCIDKNILIKYPYDNEYFSKTFSENTIKHFYIGICKKPNKPMSNRAFSIIFNQNGSQIIGMTGRWIYEKRPDYIPKWKHWGIETKKTLYNESSVNKLGTNSVIITEGPKEVWRLHELGIKNVVATLGTALSYFHIKSLISMGYKNIYLCYDNDTAGQEKQNKHVKQYKSMINIYGIGQALPRNIDIDELKQDQIESLFKDII